MKVARVVCSVATLLALTASLGAAQDKNVHVNIGGGPTFNLGDLGTHFKTGWGPAVGVTVDTPSKKLAFQFEYAYRWFDINDNAPLTTGTLLSATHTTHQLDFNIIANLTRPESPIRGYAVAGPGAYYRQVEITKYEGTGVICDPFWYVCGTYPVSSVLGKRGGWDPGFDLGGGVGFRVGQSSEFFVESRYHYVSGPQIESATQLPSGVTTGSSGGSTNGSYWPLTFGFRF
jgi:hypothetical protein